MKGIVVLIIVLGGIAFFAIWASRQGSEGSPGSETQRAAAPPEVIHASPDMDASLDRKMPTFNVDGKDIRSFARAIQGFSAMRPPSPGFLLRVEVDPAVTTNVTGVWKNKSAREILDDVCKTNGLVWRLTAPEAILIAKSR